MTLVVLMQTRSEGGSAETEHMALTVCPNRPSGTSVVTMVTPVAARLIASMNVARNSTGLSSLTG